MVVVVVAVEVEGVEESDDETIEGADVEASEEEVEAVSIFSEGDGELDDNG